MSRWSGRSLICQTTARDTPVQEIGGSVTEVIQEEVVKVL